MSPTTVRRLSDTERMLASHHSARSWLAIVLLGVSVGAGIWLFSKDIDWEVRRREARGLGLSAEANDNYQAARIYYNLALTNNPYDWETHLSLARILTRHLNDYDGALLHYLFVLGYSPEPAIQQETRSEVAILTMLRRGELENPKDAVEDMFKAVEMGAEESFQLRMSPRLRDSLSAYWEGWKSRGRGEMVFCRVRDEGDGFFDANVQLAFPDGTSMSMHFYCVKGTIWRLEASFP